MIRSKSHFNNLVSLEGTNQYSNQTGKSSAQSQRPVSPPIDIKFRMFRYRPESTKLKIIENSIPNNEKFTKVSEDLMFPIDDVELSDNDKETPETHEYNTPVEQSSSSGVFTTATTTTTTTTTITRTARTSGAIWRSAISSLNAVSSSSVNNISEKNNYYYKVSRPRQELPKGKESSSDFIHESNPSDSDSEGFFGHMEGF